MLQTRYLLLPLSLLAGACDGDAAEPVARGGECSEAGAPCVEGLTCAESEATSRCFEPVLIRGVVTDAANAGAIIDAEVIVRDEEGAAISDVATSGASGSYSTEIPVARDADGVPVGIVTLQSAAQGYLQFPGGPRVALPVDTSAATLESGVYVVENAVTDVTLIALSGDESLQTIGGRVERATDEQNVAGVLVVATDGDTSLHAVTDQRGNFTIFNAPPGDYEVRSYAQGLQVQPATVTVTADSGASVTLTATAAATATVSGNIQIVNAPGGSATSVIMVVDDTFEENFARGQVPRGLRAPSGSGTTISGDFSITGVPDGTYVVLAAFENDELVRDPDQNIGGTNIVRITVDASQDVTIDLGESFKVTEALALVSPGETGPEAVTDKPTLQWADDSSEDYYEVRVFNALGEEVWSDLNVPGVSGSDTVSVEYGGPLEEGMYYQFRVLSWRAPGGGNPSPISATEDLLGVFYLPLE